MYCKRRTAYILFLLAALGCLVFPASAQTFGPTPYLSFADSPFSSMDFSNGYFYLETFESGSLQTPGVTGLGGTVYGPASNADSVDADDGIIDGSGANGHSYFGNGANGIRFTFDASVLGTLPTHVGLVWTDGATYNDVTFQAFDASNNLVGAVVGNNLGDGNFDGGTAEDRFFGMISNQGISSIFMTSLPTPGADGSGIEVDHLQYGDPRLVTVPEPDVWGMLIGSLASCSILLRRRK